MTKPNVETRVETRVDTRDYEVRYERYKKTKSAKKVKMAVVVKDGETLSIDDLSDRCGVTAMTLRRRLRAMVSWSDLVSNDRGRTYDLLMPSVKDCQTGLVSWDLFENKRDYEFFKQAHPGGNGGLSLMISHKGVVSSLADLVRETGIPYPTVRKRIECGRSYDQVFSLEAMADADDACIEQPCSSDLDWALNPTADNLGSHKKSAERRMISLMLAGRSKIFTAQNAGPLYCEVGGAV